MGKYEKYDESDGVWRTVGGRRIFIKDGQSLSDAMKKSGKFKSASKNVKGPNSKEVKEINKKVDEDFNTEEKAKQYEQDKGLRDIAHNKEELNKRLQDMKDKGMLDKLKDEQTEYYKSKAEEYKNTKDPMFADIKEERTKEYSIKSQQSEIEKASGLKVKEAFSTDLYGNGKEDRFKLDDGRWISHTTESMGEKEDTWSINKLEKGSIESQDFKSYDDMIKHLGGNNNSTKSFADEVKNYKLKGNDEYHSAKEVLLSRFNRTYNDGDTIKDKYEERMKNIRVLEESEDYVLYASKDEEGFVNITEISSWDPKSRFREMPNVYFEQDYKGNIKAGSATVNWGAYGSQDPKTTKEFIDKLTKAQEFADKINKGKDYSKMWDNDSPKQENNTIKETPGSSLKAYSKAFEEYKKKHPNTKLTINQFVKYSEGKK